MNEKLIQMQPQAWKHAAYEKDILHGHNFETFAPDFCTAEAYHKG